MADEKKNTDVVLIGDGAGVRRVRINGNEFEVSGASPIMQGGAIGVSLTLIGVNLSAESLPAPANPALSPGN